MKPFYLRISKLGSRLTRAAAPVRVHLVHQRLRHIVEGLRLLHRRGFADRGGVDRGEAADNRTN